MRTFMLLMPVLAIIAALSGCQPQTTGDFFAVDFQSDSTVRYQLVSERTVNISLGMEEESAKKSDQTITEKLDMVIAYTPKDKFDPYAANTIEATCESAKVTRTSIGGKTTPGDAMNSLAGMSYTFEISPTGRITNYEDLDRVLKELGTKTFAATSKKQGTIKNPDMISDFIAMQYYMWDCVAAINDPLKGMKIGKSWQALQLIPFPAPIPPNSPQPAIRKTTYTLDDITGSESDRIANISSTYELDKEPLAHWASPYSKSFQMKGLFGFLRNYKFTFIEGSGSCVYDIVNGKIISDDQQYTLKSDARFLLPLKGTTPSITVNQTINVELLD